MSRPRLSPEQRGSSCVVLTALTQARGKCGWSTQALQWACDIPYRRVRAIEIGQLAASGEDQAKLSRALEVPVDELFDHEGYVLAAVKPKAAAPKTQKIPYVRGGWPKVLLARLNVGMTVEKLAQKTGLDRHRVKKIETIKAAATSEEARALAKALKAKPGDLFQGNGYTAFIPMYDEYQGYRELPPPVTALRRARAEAKNGSANSVRLRLARAADLPRGVDEYLEIEQRRATATPEVCEIIARELGKPVEKLFSPLGLALL